MLFQAVAILAAAASAVVAAPTAAVGAAFDRFFVIVLENTDYTDAIADPYLGSTLAAKGRLLTNYGAISHPSEPNYIAMISGSTQGISSDGKFNFRGKTIVDLLEAKGVTWATYQEAYPGKCSTATSSKTYYRKHNPFISFTNISGNSKRCANIKPATALASDIKAKNVPSYVFYTPDINNDGHDTGVSYASNWLQGFLEPLLSNAVFKNTLFFVTFDEDETGNNQVYGILLGAGVAAGSQDDTAYDHYSQLATVEANWGLGNLGAGDASATPFTLA